MIQPSMVQPVDKTGYTVYKLFISLNLCMLLNLSIASAVMENAIRAALIPQPLLPRGEGEPD
jgi:hypothetical protein